MSGILDTKTYSFDHATAFLAERGIHRVVLDVDGVIFDTRSFIATVAQDLTAEHHLPPLKLDPTAETEWGFLGVDEQAYRDVYRQLLKAGRLAAPPPLIRGVRNGFAMLREAGLQIDLLTAIPDAMKPVREQQLREAGLPFTEMYTVAPHASKGPVLGQLAPAIFIDDLPLHVEDALSAGCVGVVFHQPYNKGCTAPRLQNWTVRAVTDLFGKLPAYIEEKRIAAGRGMASPPDQPLSVLQND